MSRKPEYYSGVDFTTSGNIAMSGSAQMTGLLGQMQQAQHSSSYEQYMNRLQEELRIEREKNRMEREKSDYLAKMLHEETGATRVVGPYGYYDLRSYPVAIDFGSPAEPAKEEPGHADLLKSLTKEIDEWLKPTREMLKNK